jgi:hypothetical protein
MSDEAAKRPRLQIIIYIDQFVNYYYIKEGRLYLSIRVHIIYYSKTREHYWPYINTNEANRRFQFDYQRDVAIELTSAPKFQV